MKAKEQLNNTQQTKGKLSWSFSQMSCLDQSFIIEEYGL